MEIQLLLLLGGQTGTAKNMPYRDFSPEPETMMHYNNRMMTPPIEDDDREGERERTMPMISWEEYNAIHGRQGMTPPPMDDDREGTLPILSIEEYNAILAAENAAAKQVTPPPQEAVDREWSSPILSFRAITPPPGEADDDRERTLPILSIEEYNAILVDENVAKILISLAMSPEKKKKEPKRKPLIMKKKKKEPVVVVMKPQATHSYMLRSRREIK